MWHDGWKKYSSKRERFLSLLEEYDGRTYFSLAQDMQSNVEAVKKMANRLKKQGLVRFARYSSYPRGHEILVYLEKSGGV